jgi:hypothetical protein
MIPKLDFIYFWGLVECVGRFPQEQPFFETCFARSLTAANSAMNQFWRIKDFEVRIVMSGPEENWNFLVKELYIWVVVQLTFF